MKFDAHGHELPDTTPVALPLGFKTPETLAEQIQRLVRTNVSQEAANAGAETFEEADDFDIDEEDEPFDQTSPYEMEFDPVLGREVSAEMIMKDPRIAREYQQKSAASDEAREAATKEYNRRNPRKPDRGASGPSTKAGPETPADPPEKIPTDL